MKNIEIYADGVAPDAGLIAQLINVYGIKGATCNPTLAKAQCNEEMNYEQYSRFIISHFSPLPVSVQLLAQDREEMVEQGLKIAKWGENVYVKVPIVTQHGESCIPVILSLMNLGVNVNVTALFTVHQVQELLTYAIPRDVNLVLSIFAGRIGDTGRSPNSIMEPVSKMIENYPRVKLLWAGVRSMSDLLEARKFCDIITMPQAVLSKLEMKDKDLDDYCQETVQMFAKDASNFSI